MKFFIFSANYGFVSELVIFRDLVLLLGNYYLMIICYCY